MVNNKLKFAVWAGLLTVAGTAFAQGTYIRPAYQYPTAPESSGPASVQVANSPFYFAPYIGVAVGRDDNLFLSNVNEKASTVYVVSPGFRLDARDANKVIQLGYQATFGRYTQSEDDNYIDHTANAQIDVAMSRRAFMRLGFNHLRGHDARGSTDRSFSTSPDEFRLNNPYAMFAFGAPGAEGRFEAYYEHADRNYTNNRAFTVGSDRVLREFGGAFYWRVMPKTYLLAEARRTDISYDFPASPFSGTEYRYYGGVSWDATAATTGTVKVGRLERRFSNGPPEYSGTSWEALVTWKPRTYSKFDIYSARQTTESTGLGTFILTSVSGVNWTHNWSSVLSTGLDVKFQKDEYQGFDRTDDLTALGLKVGYKFRRWLTLGAEYTHIQRDSNRSLFEYDRNLYFLTATASM